MSVALHVCVCKTDNKSTNEWLTCRANKKNETQYPWEILSLFQWKVKTDFICRGFKYLVCSNCTIKVPEIRKLDYKKKKKEEYERVNI